MSDSIRTATASETPLQLMPDRPPALLREIGSGELVPLADFSPEALKTIEQISRSVSPDDAVSGEFFGAPAMRQLSERLDRTLQSVRTDEMGDKGAEIVLGIQRDFASLRLDAVRDELTGKGSVLKRAVIALPVVGKYFSAFGRMRKLHKPVLEHLDRMKQDGEILLGKLKGVLVESDRQYEAVEAAVNDFSLWLAGGQQAWIRLRDEYRAEAQSLQGSNDIQRIARLRDRAEWLDSFASGLVELRMAHLGFIASLPQVRMTQKAARIEIQNTLRGIFLDTPRIKMAIRTMASLRQINRARETSGARKKMANDLARLSADISGIAYHQALTSEGDFTDSLSTVNYVIDRVVTAVDKGLEIREANMASRAEAIRSLDEAYSRFTSGFRDSAVRGLVR